MPAAAAGHVCIRHLGCQRRNGFSARETGWASSPSTTIGTAASSPSRPRSRRCCEHPAISAVLEEEALPDVLAFGYTSGDRTLFQNIRKLMPGHRMLLDASNSRPELRCERYWDVPVLDMGHPDLDQRGWIAETRSRLEESVQLHLMSNVPLGVFLSGGVDSSAIAALTQRASSRSGTNVRRRLCGIQVQRVKPRAASGHRSRHRSSRRHGRHGRFLRRIAQAHLARR